MAWKRYTSYFPKLDLTLKHSQIALCHSSGIRSALLSNAKYIIAMDPSEFPTNMPNIYIWVRQGREKEIPHSVHKEQTHYPYEIGRPDLHLQHS